MARDSSIFGDELEIRIWMGKECGFTAIFNISKPLTPRKMELQWKKGSARILPCLCGPRVLPMGAVENPK